MRLGIITSMVIVALLSITTGLMAQGEGSATSDVTTHGYWVSGGYEGSFGPSVGLWRGAATVRMNSLVASLRFYHGLDERPPSPHPSAILFQSDVAPLVYHREIALAAGWTTYGSPLQIAFTAGIGYLFGVRHGALLRDTCRVTGAGFFISSSCFTEYERIEFGSVAVPIEAEMSWSPFGYLGIGLSGHVTLSPDLIFFGGAFNVHLGLLRDE